MERYYFLSEWRLETKTSELPLYLYPLPQKSQETGEIEKETANLKYALMEQNPGVLVESAGYLIGSFQKIENWGDITPLRDQFRCIDVTSSIERRLLERLLARSFEQAQDPGKYYVLKNRLIEKVPQIFGDVEMRRCLEFQMNVRPSGSISIAFDLSHQFSYRKTFYQMMREGRKLEPYCKVIDIVKRKTYLFKRMSDRTVSDPSLDNGESPIDYYRNQGQEQFVKNIPPHTPAAVCISPGGSKDLHFIPQLLRLVCTWEHVPKEGKVKTRLSVHQHTSLLIQDMGNCLENWKRNCPDLPVQYKKAGLLANYAGYRIKVMEQPKLLFGKGWGDTKMSRGLNQGGVVAPPKEPIECQLLIDEDVIKAFSERNQRGVNLFTKELKEKSNQLGVPLKRSSLDSGKIGRIHFDHAPRLREKLKEAARRMDPEQPLIIVAKKENLEKPFGTRDGYSLLKQILGRENSLRTQVVTFETSQLKGKGRENILINILLGLYVKTGIHPWKLKHQLHSDCFVGLDVSHEEGIHTAGIIQVVGKDGTPLWTKPVSHSERGEIIRKNTLEQSIHYTIDQYKQKEGRYPLHITFHRDGKGHDAEVKAIREILETYNIAFDYVAIEKTVVPRMACMDEHEKWINPMGHAYIRDSERIAYLCSSDPSDHVGMARPIRIRCLTENLHIDRIIEDLYRLTFMNLHAINKSRLPSTINYADKSSTFFSRGLLPLDKAMPIQSV